MSLLTKWTKFLDFATLSYIIWEIWTKIVHIQRGHSKKENLPTASRINTFYSNGLGSCDFSWATRCSWASWTRWRAASCPSKMLWTRPGRTGVSCSSSRAWLRRYQHFRPSRLGSLSDVIPKLSPHQQSEFPCRPVSEFGVVSYSTLWRMGNFREGLCWWCW